MPGGIMADTTVQTLDAILVAYTGGVAALTYSSRRFLETWEEKRTIRFPTAAVLLISAAFVCVGLCVLPGKLKAAVDCLAGVQEAGPSPAGAPAVASGPAPARLETAQAPSKPLIVQLVRPGDVGLKDGGTKPRHKRTHAATRSTPLQSSLANTDPAWEVRPSGAALGAYYPPRAQEKGVPGVVALLCDATTEGRLANCQVASEEPGDYGFGSAAVQAMENLARFRPAIRHGIPTTERVTVPMRFEPS